MLRRNFLHLARIREITIDPAYVIMTLMSNYTLKDQVFYTDATVAYCNITFSHTHDGRGDRVNVAYFSPDPSAFRNRFLATPAAVWPSTPRPRQ